jgi:hypothetical protein
MSKYENPKGLFTEISAYIKQCEANKEPGVLVDNLLDDVKNNVDLESVPQGWFIDTSLKTEIAVGLAQAGYRSLVPGRGIYINPAKINNKDLVDYLIQRQMISISQKEEVLKTLEKIQKQIPDDIEGQLHLDLETGEMFERMSNKQILSMLEVCMKDA